MPDIRAVFVDLDDTFLAPDKSIPPANLALMDELAERGIELVPCTGRHVQGVPAAMRSHTCVHHVVASNGGIVHDLHTDEDLHVVSIPEDKVVAVYDRLRELPVIFDAFADGKAYSELVRKPLFDQINVPEGLRTYLKEGRTFVSTTIPELLPTVGPITKLSLFFLGQAGAQAIDAAIHAAGDLYYVQTSAACYESMHVDATKGSALTWLAAHMNWEIGQTVAFGDNHNDVSMIEAAGIGVVMENGEPEVKALTTHIAPPAAEGGVAQYLQNLLPAAEA